MELTNFEKSKIPSSHNFHRITSKLVLYLEFFLHIVVSISGHWDFLTIIT